MSLSRQGGRMIVGEIVEMQTQVYICVNEQGTLEHLQQVNPVRLLLWHFRNFFKPFKSVRETKDFLRII